MQKAKERGMPISMDAAYDSQEKWLSFGSKAI